MSTIFYTDDDSDDTQVFAQALKELNKNVSLKTSEDGDELLHSLRNPPPKPSLIFLDLNMPGKDGRQTLKEIKSDKEFENYPVIIFSTSSSKEDIDLTYKYGASLFVNKPAKYHDLKKVIEHCITTDWNNYIRPKKENYFLTAS